MKRQVDGHASLNGLVAQAYFAELEEMAGRERGLVDAFNNIVDLGEDLAEDEIDDWADARNDLEDARDDGDAAAISDARRAEVEARAAWERKLAEVLGTTSREEVDSHGRLTDADWERLKASLSDWDPVEEEPPPLVALAFSSQVLPVGEVPMARWDQRVDALATADGVFGCGSSVGDAVSSGARSAPETRAA